MVIENNSTLTKMLRDNGASPDLLHMASFHIEDEDALETIETEMKRRGNHDKNRAVARYLTIGKKGAAQAGGQTKESLLVAVQNLLTLNLQKAAEDERRRAEIQKHHEDEKNEHHVTRELLTNSNSSMIAAVRDFEKTGRDNDAALHRGLMFVNERLDKITDDAVKSQRKLKNMAIAMAVGLAMLIIGTTAFGQVQTPTLPAQVVAACAGSSFTVGQRIYLTELANGSLCASVSGTVTVSGNVTVVQPTGTNLHIVADSGTITTVGTVTTITNPVTVTDGAGALNVIVDSGSVTANAGTNLNTSTLATEATLAALDAKVTAVNTGAVTVSTFPDNEPFNVAQINGTTTDDGNGAIGTGTLRVAQGSGSTVSSCADETQVASVPISTATSGNVELVAISGSTVVYVCGYNAIATGTVAIQFISGTGTACATGETNKTGAYPLIANSGLAVGNGGAMQFKGAAGEAVCIELSGAVQVDGLLTYVQR